MSYGLTFEIREIKASNAVCRHKDHSCDDPIARGEEVLVVTFMGNRAIFCKKHMRDVIEQMKTVSEEFYIRVRCN